MEKFLNKMERKFGRYAISGLMKYICVLYIIGLFINIASPQVYYYYLSLNPYRILHGEVWRLVTFLIQSPNSNVIFFIFTLYLCRCFIYHYRFFCRLFHDWTGLSHGYLLY